MAKSKHEDNRPLAEKLKTLRTAIRNKQSAGKIPHVLFNIERANRLLKCGGLTPEQYATIVGHMLEPLKRTKTKAAPAEKQPAEKEPPQRQTVLTKFTCSVLAALAKKCDARNLTSEKMTRHVLPSRNIEKNQLCGMHNCKRRCTPWPLNDGSRLFNGHECFTLCRHCSLSTHMLRNTSGSPNSGKSTVEDLPDFEATFRNVRHKVHLIRVLQDLKLDGAVQCLSSTARRHYIYSERTGGVIVLAYKDSIQYPELMAVFAANVKGIVYINDNFVRCMRVTKRQHEGLNAPLPRIVNEHV